MRDEEIGIQDDIFSGGLAYVVGNVGCLISAKLDLAGPGYDNSRAMIFPAKKGLVEKLLKSSKLNRQRNCYIRRFFLFLLLLFLFSGMRARVAGTNCISRLLSRNEASYVMITNGDERALTLRESCLVRRQIKFISRRAETV